MSKMNIEEIGNMLDLLEANYGASMYKDTNHENVLKLWTVMFEDDDPYEVAMAVKDCISTLEFPPKIADIRKRMANSRIKGQMTEMEAFQAIKTAMKQASDRVKSQKAFNDLPGICRKLVGSESQLRDWRIVSDETFETVVCSMICRSYRILADQEIGYHALPTQMKRAEDWRIETPEQGALPELPKPQTVDDILAAAELDSQQYRERLGITINPEYADRVNDFKQPVTADDIRRVEYAEKRKAEWSFK